MSKEKIMVFIPVYNCEKQITRVLNQFDNKILKFIDEIVIINNISTDNSEKIIKEYIKKHELSITLLRNKENYNLGGSHKVAFDYAIKNNYDYLIVLHGDDQGDIHDMFDILKTKKYRDYDELLGSRFSKGSHLEGYSKFRTFGNKVYNIIFSICMHQKVEDLGSGLNMYKVNVLKSKYYLKYPDKLTFNCFMLFASKSFNHRTMYFPLTWKEDDQVSNVKMVSQAYITLKIAIQYLLKKDKFLNSEHREKIVDKYDSKVIAKKERK